MQPRSTKTRLTVIFSLSTALGRHSSSSFATLNLIHHPNGWFIDGERMVQIKSLVSFGRKGAEQARRDRSDLRSEFILGRGDDEAFEFLPQLLDRSRRALEALAVEFAFERLDPQVQMRDQRRVVRKLRPRIGRFGPSTGRLRLRQVALGFDPQPRFAFNLQRRAGGKSPAGGILS
jgi:hypothetical protein